MYPIHSLSTLVPHYKTKNSIEWHVLTGDENKKNIILHG
jgi:hypothetical protein